MVATTALLAGFAACSLKKQGRTLVEGAAEGLNSRRDSISTALTPLVDTTLFEVNRILRDSLALELDGAIARVLSTVEDRFDTLQTDASEYLRGDLNRSVRVLVDSTANNLDRRLDNLIIELTETARTRLASAAGTLSDSLVTRALLSLDEGLRGPLRQTVIEFVQEVADTVRTSATGIAEDPVFKRLFRGVGLIIVIPLAILLIVGIYLAYRWSRNRKRSLEVITAAIRDRGSEDLKDTIQQRAEARDVEGFLRGYLKKRNMI